MAPYVRTTSPISLFSFSNSSSPGRSWIEAHRFSLHERRSKDIIDDAWLDDGAAGNDKHGGGAGAVGKLLDLSPVLGPFCRYAAGHALSSLVLTRTTEPALGRARRSPFNSVSSLTWSRSKGWGVGNVEIAGAKHAARAPIHAPSRLCRHSCKVNSVRPPPRRGTLSLCLSLSSLIFVSGSGRGSGSGDGGGGGAQA